MMFDLPDSKTLYAALCARDARYEGRAYVGVSSTGIFCRLSCPARNPKFENCQFFASPGACIEAGFRACKRCKPLKAAAGDDPMVQPLIDALEARPTHRWREGDLVQLGYDPSTVRRAFKRHFGMTFLEMARQRRLREGFTALSAGEPVIAAQIDAGFDSPSAFRAAFARLVGMAPGAFRKDALLLADWIDTPLGAMIADESMVETVLDAGGFAHGHTYAGNPLAVAAANAMLDIIEEEQLCARATNIGRTVMSRLTAISARQGMEAIGDVRGLGAMIAFELVTDRETRTPDTALTAAIVAQAEQRGLILLPCGTRGNVVRLLPPLTTSDAVVEEALDLLETSIEAAITHVQS